MTYDPIDDNADGTITNYNLGTDTDPGPVAGSSPNIVVYEDSGGTAHAVTNDTDYIGSGAFDAAQQAIEARLNETDRPEGNDDLPGNIHVFIKPGVYEVSQGLVVDSYDGVESFTVESAAPQGAYILTQGINSEPAIKLQPPSDPTTGAASNRIRDVAIRNLRLDNSDTKKRGEGNTGTRDIDGIYVQHIDELHIENVKPTLYQSGISINNVYEGRVESIRVTSCGDSGNSRAAIEVLPAGGGGGSADDTNHISWDDIRGGFGIEYAFIELGDGADFHTFDGVSVEMDGPFCIHDGGQVNFNNAFIGGQGPHFDIRSGRCQINGGEYNVSDASWMLAGRDGGIARVNVMGAEIRGDTAHDVIMIMDAYASITGCRITTGKRGITVSADDQGKYLDTGSPDTFAAEIAGNTIVGMEEDGVFTNRGFKSAWQWHVSDNQIVEAAASGTGYPIQINSAGVTAVNNELSVDAGVSSRVGVFDGDFNDHLHIKDNKEIHGDGNLSALDNKGQSGSTYESLSGEATISSGSTSTTVTHLLDGTPEGANISLTPLSSLGSATTFWVDSITSTDFSINVDTDPTQDVTFAWRAEL